MGLWNIFYISLKELRTSPRMNNEICKSMDKEGTMKLTFKGDGSFLLPPDQICTFEHDGRKIHCNVDLLIEDYKEKQADLVDIDKIFEQTNTVNTEYAMKTDFSVPIIVVCFNDGTYEILDGNHRLFRAAHEGKSQILAHILNELELEKYIMC